MAPEQSSNSLSRKDPWSMNRLTFPMVRRGQTTLCDRSVLLLAKFHIECSMIYKGILCRIILMIICNMLYQIR